MNPLEEAKESGYYLQRGVRFLRLSCEYFLGTLWPADCRAWGARFFEPATSAFWNSVRNVRPDLYKGFNPWDRISDVDSVRSSLATAGLSEIEVVAEYGSQPVNSPEDWWAMIMGSGYRGTIAQLDPADLERVRNENLDFINRTRLRSLESNVVYVTAEKASHIEAQKHKTSERKAH
jgi:hypothetical protein